MEVNGQGATEDGGCLAPELRLHILSLLPHDNLALGGRLSSKDAAQRFTELSCRTAHLRQPLPDYAITAGLDSAQSALRQLTFRQKLHLPATAAASGCEANVEFALQLLQPHVFPEVLRTDGGYTWAYEGPASAHLPPTADVGSAVVASGLARLLPSLEQRCPGLLDPGRTLEAAARHCDLAGLQAAGDVLGQRLLSSIREMKSTEKPKDDYYEFDEGDPELEAVAESDRVWQRIMREAAGSSTPDAIAKMALVLEKSKQYDCYVCNAPAWGAAAASGDMARLQWLWHNTFFDWRHIGILAAMLHDASLDFFDEMEAEKMHPWTKHGHLPAADHGVWGAHDLDVTVAGSPRDSAAKLRWMEGRGTPIGFPEGVKAAAAAGNLEALQLLLERRQQHQLLPEEERGLGLELGLGAEMDVVEWAASGGHVSTAAWLVQAGWPLTPECLEIAVRRGDLPMVRWLVEAGCPHEDLTVSDVVQDWPIRTAVDIQRLEEALRLVVAAGWPPRGEEGLQPLEAAVAGDKPWPVWSVLRELLPSCAAREALTEYASTHAATTGCEATLEGLVAESNRGASVEWYAGTAGAGDRGTLECVRRLGVPLGEGVLQEAVSSGALLAALCWLAEQGMPVGRMEVKRALKGVPGSYRREQERREVKAWLQGL